MIQYSHFHLPAHFWYSQEMTNFSARVTYSERQRNSYIINSTSRVKFLVSQKIRTKERHVETTRKIPRPPPQQNSFSRLRTLQRTDKVLWETTENYRLHIPLHFVHYFTRLVSDITSHWYDWNTQ